MVWMSQTKRHSWPNTAFIDWLPGCAYADWFGYGLTGFVAAYAKHVGTTPLLLLSLWLLYWRGVTRPALQCATKREQQTILKIHRFYDAAEQQVKVIRSNARTSSAGNLARLQASEHIQCEIQFYVLWLRLSTRKPITMWWKTA